MTVILTIVIFILGICIGYVLNGLFSINTRNEEIDDAFKRGREYERMCITQTLEDQKK